MKLIIGSLIIFLLVIVFLFALFPSDISVSRIIQIKNSKEQISKKIADLRSWKSWNELLMNPPAEDITNSYSDRIDSNFIQSGGMSVEILKSSPDTVLTRWQQGN